MTFHVKHVESVLEQVMTTNFVHHAHQNIHFIGLQTVNVMQMDVHLEVTFQALIFAKVALVHA